MNKSPSVPQANLAYERKLREMRKKLGSPSVNNLLRKVK
jgi:hypothetical protein